MNRFALCLAALCLMPMALWAISSPPPSISPASLEFYSYVNESSTRQMHVQNNYTFDLLVITIVITGPDASQFQLGVAKPAYIGAWTLPDASWCGPLGPTDTDTDSDGCSDSIETLFDMDINNPDTDGDGYTDLPDFLPLDPAYHAFPDLYVDYGAGGNLPILFQPTDDGNKQATLTLTYATYSTPPMESVTITTSPVTLKPSLCRELTSSAGRWIRNVVCR